MSDIIRKAAQIERIDVETDGVRRTLFLASTDTPDRALDVVDQASWKLDNYRSNPIVLVDHDYSTDAVVGRGDVQVTERGLTLEIVRWSDRPRAAGIRADVEAGVLSAVSVGFRPGRRVLRTELPKDHPAWSESGWGMVYYDCELLEISIVAVPMNPEALAERAIRAAGLTVGDLAETLLADPALRAELRARLTLAGETPAPADLGGLFGLPKGPILPTHLSLWGLP